MSCRFSEGRVATASESLRKHRDDIHRANTSMNKSDFYYDLPQELIETVKNFEVPEAVKSLPSCPKQPIIYHEEVNRPQPRLDRDLEKGMATNVGRIRTDNILDFRFVSVSHNTIRGAAGGSILNGELIARRFFGK